jgi:hypothetical protein
LAEDRRKQVEYSGEEAFALMEKTAERMKHAEMWVLTDHCPSSPVTAHQSGRRQKNEPGRIFVTAGFISLRC